MRPSRGETSRNLATKHSDRGGKHASRSYASHFRWRGGDCLELSARARERESERFENSIPSWGPLPLKKQPLPKKPFKEGAMVVMQQLRGEAGRKTMTAERREEKRDSFLFVFSAAAASLTATLWHAESRRFPNSVKTLQRNSVSLWLSSSSPTDPCCLGSPGRAPVRLSGRPSALRSQCTPASHRLFPLVLRGSQ